MDSEKSAAHQWENTAKQISEKILNGALKVSKETIEKVATKGGKTAEEVFGREVDSKLVQIDTTMRASRILTRKCGGCRCGCNCDGYNTMLIK